MAAQLGIILVSGQAGIEQALTGYRVWRADSPDALRRTVSEHTPNLLIVDASRTDMLQSLPDDAGLEIILLGDGAATDDPRVLCALPEDIPTALLKALIDQAAQRVEAERALQEGRQLLQSAGDQLPFGFYAKDLQGRKTLSSRADWATIGLGSEQDILGKTDLDLFSINDGRPSYQKDMEVMRTGEPLIDHQEQFTMQDGRTLWVLTSKVPLRDEQGQIVGLAGSAHDITEQKATEDALALSQARVRATFDASPVGIAVLAKGRFVEVNDAATSLFGYTRQELLGMRIDAITHPDDMTANRESLQQKLQAGEPAVAKVRHIAKGGEVVWCLTSLSPVRDSHGARLYTVAHFQDITERRRFEAALLESESHFRALMEQSPMAISVFEPDGTLRQSNRAYAELFGLSEVLSRDSIGKYNVFEAEWLKASSYLDDVKRAFAGEAVCLPEYQPDYLETVRRLGHETTGLKRPWIRSHYYPLHDEYGQVRSVVLIHEDLTQVHASEEALRRQKNLLDGILEILPVGLWVADETGNLVRTNAAGREIWGAEPHVGMEKYGVFSARRLPSREPIAPDDWALAHTVTQGTTVSGEELEIDAFDGQTKMILNYTAPVFDDDGGVLAAVVVNVDITELKQTESALREREHVLRQAQQVAGMGSWVWHIPEDRLVWSEGLYALFGLDPQTHGKDLDETIVDLVHPDDRHLVGASTAAIMEEGQVRSVEYRIVRPNGEIRHIWAQAGMLLKDTTGRPTSLIGIMQDITERKQAEEALRESEARFRAMMEQSPLPTAIYQPDGIILEMNEAFADLFGLSEEMIQEQIGVYDIRRAAAMTSPELSAMVERAFAGEHVEVPVYQSAAVDLLAEGGFNTEGMRRPWIRSSYFPILDEQGQVCNVVLVHEDVTEATESARALAESEERFRALMEQSPIGIAIFEPDGTMTAMNQAYADAFGFSPEAAQERIDKINLLRAVKLRGGETKALIESAFAGETVIIPEYQTRARKDALDMGFTEGTRDPWVRSRCFPILDDSGKVALVVNQVEDVTEAHEAEDAVRKSRERYQTLFENMTQGVFYQSASGEITDINDAGLRMFGLTREQILGRKNDDSDWYVIDDDGRQMAPEEMPSSVALRSGEPQLDRIVGMRNLDHGGIVWLNLNALPLFEPEAKTPSQVFVTMQNVTERRNARQSLEHSEAELQHLTSRQDALLSAIPDIVTETDKEKTMTWLNPAGIAFFGEDAVGRQASDFFLGEQDIYQAVEPLFQGSEETIYVESWQRRRDGEKRLLAWWCRTLKDDDGNVVGALSTARDITDQRRLEEQYRQSQKMESVGRLAGGVAHDFNNMLQVILGHTEMALEDAPEGSDLRDDLTEVQNAARRSARLTAQLLGFARQQTVSPEVMDVNDAIARMLRMLQRLIGEEIDLVWKPGGGLGSVRIDPSQVDQILANLCVNARDAIGGIGEVIIETRNVDLDFEYCRVHSECQPGQYVMLSVSDNGSGMNDEVLGHLFEPFFTTKDVGEGTGLGLATVYGIVKQNDGFVNVYSEVGEGTTFRIYLPRLRHEVQESPAVSQRRVARGFETILIVEDEPTILRLAQSALRRQGYTVLTATKPSEAFNLVAMTEETIDLLVTDVVMPEMNGREMRDRILETRPTLKTLYMSGYTADVVVHRGVIEEGLELLQKPFSIRDLASKVRQVLDA